MFINNGLNSWAHFPAKVTYPPPVIPFTALSSFSPQFYFILPKLPNICWLLWVLNVLTGIVGVMQRLRRIWCALCSQRPFISWKAKLPTVALHYRCIKWGCMAPWELITAVVTSWVYLYWFPSVARRSFFDERWEVHLCTNCMVFKSSKQFMVYCSKNSGIIRISPMAQILDIRRTLTSQKFDSTQLQEEILKKSLQFLLLIVCLGYGVRKRSPLLKVCQRKFVRETKCFAVEPQFQENKLVCIN